MRTFRERAAVATIGMAFGVASCTGSIGEAFEDSPTSPDFGSPAGGVTIDGKTIVVGKMGVRRLSRHEYDVVLNDLIRDGSAPSSLLPQDQSTPFDNDSSTQNPSQALVDSAELLARDAIQKLILDPARLMAVSGCKPTGPTDSACFHSFVRRFGRMALRRTLASVEEDEFVALALATAAEAADASVGLGAVIQALLQDPEFLYRIERGTAVAGTPGVLKLNDFEIATRLSFFVWGTTPNDWLLDQAEHGGMSGKEGIRSVVTTMLNDARARTAIDRFHAMWLGYETLPHAPDLAQAMRAETAALVTRIVFEQKSSWLDLFQSPRTYVNDTLAQLYGLPAPGGKWAWVDYGNTGRGGLLSHGSFLSVAANVSDTSPTKRGKFIRNQLMCQTIPPPPPNAKADAPPAAMQAKCKWDQYAIHRQSAACGSCHSQMDPVGFGLENYNLQGRYRAFDDGKPDCPIAGDGEIVGVGKFHGPAELGQVLSKSGLLDQCLVTNAFRYVMGRQPEPDDQAFIDDIGTKLRDGGYRLDQMILDIATNETFGFRLAEDGGMP